MNTSARIAWPEKQREMVEWVIDSHPWNSLKFRDEVDEVDRARRFSGVIIGVLGDLCGAAHPYPPRKAVGHIALECMCPRPVQHKKT
jgi:hypothetical protein